jgi:hypothetical protein
VWTRTGFSKHLARLMLFNFFATATLSRLLNILCALSVEDCEELTVKL